MNATHAQPFRRIVACVDFSETSREVVAQAWRVADRDRAEVHLLHVFQPEWRVWTSMTEPPALGDFEKSYRTLLEGNLRQFAAACPRQTRSCPCARGRRMGTALPSTAGTWTPTRDPWFQGPDELKYVLLGSTVERLLKEIPCSVLVVRPPVAATAATTGGSSGQ